MSPTPATLDWFPALGVLAVGLGLGAVLVHRVLAAARPVARARAGLLLHLGDLEGKRDALLQQLREMEDTASKRTPEQLARERYALELETAQVLLALEDRRASVDAIPAVGDDRGGRRRKRTSRRAHPARSPGAGRRGFAWVIGSAAALLLLVFLVVQSATPREPLAGRRITGTVDIDPSLEGAVPPGAVLFVFAREAGAAGGPPVAVKRLPARFPAAFELSEADSMMGRPFPETLLLEARLDSDGDPSTRPATDPRARLDRVKAGRTGLHLVLRRPR